MPFNSIKKSAIFQSTRTWPKASLQNDPSCDEACTDNANQKTYKRDTRSRKDTDIERDHSHRMMRFLHTIQHQRQGNNSVSDPLERVHAERIKRILSRQILRSFSNKGPSDRREQ